MSDLKDNPSVDIADNLAEVAEAIAAAAKEADREPGEVTLVAVTKTFAPAMVERAIEAGQRVFGENRVQEAAAKYPELREGTPDLVLHLIGPLQTNKADDAVELFDVIETLDRPKLARSLAKSMEKKGRRPACFIQVNTGEEPQKAGVAPDDLEDLVRLARDELNLPVEGLMCIPPLDEEPAMHFALLAELAKPLGLEKLSMGMSADYPAAIRLGATHVRVGSGIFGPRDKA